MLTIITCLVNVYNNLSIISFLVSSKLKIYYSSARFFSCPSNEVDSFGERKQWRRSDREQTGETHRLLQSSGTWHSLFHPQYPSFLLSSSFPLCLPVLPLPPHRLNLPPRRHPATQIYFTMQEKVLLPRWIFSSFLYFNCDVSAPRELCAHFIFFGKHFILLAVPGQHPSSSPPVPQSRMPRPLADVFDFAKCALEIWFRLLHRDEGCLPCAIQYTHMHSHTHLRCQLEWQSQPRPRSAFPGLCPAADAHCHMCCVWRQKWWQIALILWFGHITS